MIKKLFSKRDLVLLGVIILSLGISVYFWK